ncbi:nuclear transport factor 2 family protein [Roseobacter sp.]|uniref:YybH family protein n=1 Tax=Roseobacter sp. TaxID=1907202 RepID=UPI0025FD64AE|nr:nuclear transport factor 2 family protein [Roseobacter sp.]
MTFQTELRHILDRMEHAYNSGDAAACAALFTENAQLHSPFGPSASGRREIETLHRDWVDDAGNKAFTVTGSGCDGALAWCLLRFSEGDAQSEGTSLIVLEHHHDEGWLIRSCCLHGDPD